MTTTLVMAKLGSTNEAVNVDAIDRANLKIRSTEQTNDGYRTIFVLATGNSADEVTVTVNANFDPKANDGEGASRYTIRLKTWLIETDDTTGEVLYRQPAEFGVFMTLPGLGVRDASLVMQALMNCFSLVYQTVTTNEPDTVVITSLANFITEIH